MSYSLNNPIYCVTCKKQITAQNKTCPYCGADQRPPKDRPPTTALAVTTPTVEDPPTLASTGPWTVAKSQSSYAHDEYLRQYVTFYWYRLFALPLIFQYPSSILLGCGTVFIIFSIYGIMMQQYLRRKVAEKEIDPNLLQKSALKKFIPGAIIYMVIVTSLVIISQYLLHQYIYEHFVKPNEIQNNSSRDNLNEKSPSDQPGIPNSFSRLQ